MEPRPKQYLAGAQHVAHMVRRGRRQDSEPTCWLERPRLGPLDPTYTQTAWCSNMAIEFMRGQRQFTPWLMSVNIYQPHAPYWPTAEYLGHYNPVDYSLAC
jgi:hypothetical protein